jgi:autotransporter-associated beta strand protein
VDGPGTLTLGGTLSATNTALTKTGVGTLVLAGGNGIKSVTLSAGTLYVGQSTSLGSGTLSLGGASFGAKNAVILSNAVTLAGNSSFVADSKEITFSGNAALTGTRTLTVDSSAPVNFAGIISGAFGLTKSGDGTMVLKGSSANTYTGATIVNSGQLTLAKTSGNAFAGGLTIGNGSGDAASARVQLAASNQIPDAAAATILADGQLDLQSNTDTIGALTLTGGSVIGTGTLGLGADLVFNGTSGATSFISSKLSLGANRTFNVGSNGLNAADLTISGGISGPASTPPARPARAFRALGPLSPTKPVRYSNGP